MKSGQNGFVSYLEAGASNSDNVSGEMPAQQAWDFIKKFVTSGTKFRFKKDPDQKVYTIKEFYQGSWGWTSPYVGALNEGVYHEDRRGPKWGAYGIRNVISGYSDSGSPSITIGKDGQ